MTPERCQGPGCHRFVRFSTLCETHYRQLKRLGVMRPIRVYHRWHDLKAYLRESARLFANAQTEAEIRRAEADLLRAAESWGRRAIQQRAA